MADKILSCEFTADYGHYPACQTVDMDEDKHIEEYLEFCKQVYLRMKHEGSWPWADSTDDDDLVESKNN